MGDRTWANIKFVVPDPVPAGLEKAVSYDVEDIESGGDWTEGRSLVLIPGALFEGSGCEINYGTMNCIDELKAAQIPYITRWDAGGEYGPGEYYVTYDKDGTPIEQYHAIDEDGYEVIQARALREILKNGKHPFTQITLIKSLLEAHCPEFPELKAKITDEQEIAWWAAFSKNAERQQMHDEISMLEDASVKNEAKIAQLRGQLARMA